MHCKLEHTIISRERKNKQPSTKERKEGPGKTTLLMAHHHCTSAAWLPGCLPDTLLLLLLLLHLLSCQKKKRGRAFASQQSLHMCSTLLLLSVQKAFPSSSLLACSKKSRTVACARAYWRAGSSTPTLLIGCGIFPSKNRVQIGFFEDSSSFDSTLTSYLLIRRRFFLSEINLEIANFFFRIWKKNTEAGKLYW